MTHRLAALSAVFFLLGSAYSDQANSEPVGRRMIPPASAQDGPPAPSPAIANPRPGQALADIYGEKGDGSGSYALEDGELVSFWYGYRFELGGQRYYTAFAISTPREQGDSQTDPAALVMIGQATYVLDTDGGKPYWTLFHAQSRAGEFGSHGKPDQIDAKRSAQRYVMQNGHLLLAVPTIAFVNGETRRGFAVFTFDPAKNDLGDYEGWVYLGTLATGGDNSAACDEDGPVKCVSSTGTLEFVAPQSGTMPGFRVTLRGTRISGPAQTRTLGPGDTLTYVYDARTKRYSPPLER